MNCCYFVLDWNLRRYSFLNILLAISSFITLDKPQRRAFLYLHTSIPREEHWSNNIKETLPFKYWSASNITWYIKIVLLKINTEKYAGSLLVGSVVMEKTLHLTILKRNIHLARSRETLKWNPFISFSTSLQQTGISHGHTEYLKLTTRDTSLGEKKNQNVRVPQGRWHLTTQSFN